jgi:hypothetical protein
METESADPEVKGETEDADDKDSVPDPDERLDREEIREKIKDTFGADSPMVKVAACESDFRQFAGDELLRNPKTGALGVFQFIASYHKDQAEDLGFDLKDTKDNIAYAKYLYDKRGLSPWSASSLCWDDGEVTATDIENQNIDAPGGILLPKSERETDNNDADAAESDVSGADIGITEKLVSGVRSPQVKRLQEVLNENGFAVSSNGPGSPGEETNFFGAKTRSAVKSFQCEQDIVCEGGRYSTGYGTVTERTRVALAGMNEDNSGQGIIRREEDEEAEDKEDEALAVNQEKSETNQPLRKQVAQLAQRIEALRDQIN